MRLCECAETAAMRTGEEQDAVERSMAVHPAGFPIAHDGGGMLQVRHTPEEADVVCSRALWDQADATQRKTFRIAKDAYEGSVRADVKLYISPEGTLLQVCALCAPSREELSARRRGVGFGSSAA